MYLEISGRQCGKTTRLVEHAAYNILRNIYTGYFRIGILSPNTRNSNEIKLKIIHKIKGILETHNGFGDWFSVNIGDITLDNVIETFGERIKTNIHRTCGYSLDFCYFDEFAFIPPEFIQNVLPMINSDCGLGYWCSSPNGIDESTTQMLIDYCNASMIPIQSYSFLQDAIDNRHIYGYDMYIDHFNFFCEYHNLNIMTNNPEGEKIGLIMKEIKRHKFNG